MHPGNAMPVSGQKRCGCYKSSQGPIPHQEAAADNAIFVDCQIAKAQITCWHTWRESDAQIGSTFTEFADGNSLLTCL